MSNSIETKKKGLSANVRNNLRALGVVAIALLALVGFVALCELYQHACLTVWAR